MPKSTHSKRANAARRDPVADRRLFLLALRSGDDARIEATWPGTVVAKAMLVDKAIAMHGDGDYSITDRGLAELVGPGHETTGPEELVEVIEADEDGLEPEQTGQYGEDDVAGSELDEPVVGAPVGSGGNNADHEREESGSHDELAELDRDAVEQEQLDAEYDATVVEIRAEIGTICACGCGAGITPKRVFRQGHDQRLIGILAQTAAAGKEIGHLSGGVLVTGRAAAYGAKVLGEGGQIKLAEAIKRAVDQAAKPRSARVRHEAAALKQDLARSETGTPAIDAGIEPGPGSRKLAKVPHEPVPQTGDEVKVRIGRHEYYARVHGMNQSGKVTAVEYTVKSSGAKKVALEGKFELLAD